MTLPPWTEKLTGTIRDCVDDVTLRTRDDVRRYIEALPLRRAMSIPWHDVTKLLLQGADAEALTQAVKLALRNEGRLDERGEH